MELGTYRSWQSRTPLKHTGRAFHNEGVAHWNDLLDRKEAEVVAELARYPELDVSHSFIPRWLPFPRS